MRLGSKRLLGVSKKSSRRAGFVLLLALVIIMITLGLWYCVCILRPGVITMAKSRAKEIATLTVNNVIAEKLKKENIDVSDVAAFTYDGNGDIASVSANVAQVSRIKSELAIEVTEAVGKISDSQLNIPLGSLSGVDIFYGTGPKIPIKIVPYGYANADIMTKFSSAGINQTIFEVVAEVTADVAVFMPTVRTQQRISASVPVISAIVVGDVPDSYTNVDRHGEDYEEDVMELLE